MKTTKLLFLLIINYLFLNSQNNPFEFYGPYNAPVYNNIQDGYRNKESCYKLDLNYLPESEKIWTKLFEIKTVQVLQFSINNLDTIPDGLGDLSQLNYLGINAPLQILPQSIGYLNQLKSLKLMNTSLDSLAPSMKFLYQLQEMEVHSNTDTLDLNLQFSQLKKLRSLLLFQCVIDSISPQFSLAPAIEELYFIKTNFVHSYDSIAFPKHLKTLILNDNQINSFPENILELKQLNYLNLRTNQLEEIPEKISRLTTLETLDVRENPLSPYQLALLKALLPNTQILHDPIIEEEE